MRAPGCLVILLFFVPLTTHAQQARVGEAAIDLQLRDRWLHGSERQQFVPLSERRHWISIDSTSAHPEGEALHLSTNWPSRRPGGRVVVDLAGRVTAVHASPRQRPRSPLTSQADSIRSRRYALSDGGEQARLPESDLWNVIPLIRHGALERGMRWCDTVEVSAEAGGFRQSLRVERVSEVMGDTAIDRAHLWIVRDSALVHYRERWMQDERTLDTVVVVERRATGVVRGRSLYAVDRTIAVIRDDTTFLSGGAVLEYPDGRTYRTPARYDRIRRWERHEQAHADRLREALRERGRTERAALPARFEELQHRLARGDSAALDSLLVAWRQTSDPDERLMTRGLLLMSSARAPALREALRTTMLEAGDTAGAVRDLLSAIPARRPIDGEVVALLLPFLRDPGRAFAFGLDRDPFYENLREALLNSPPAITADVPAWPCSPDACQRLASEWPGATEPRLRDLALITNLVLDPSRWADEVLDRADAGSALVQPAVELIEGVGATWPAASAAPLPRPTDDWRAWLEWMNGTDPEYRARIGRRGPTPVRFERSHATAIRFNMRLTGRKVVDEVERRLANASSDSARLVYDAVLLGMGAREPDPAQAARRLVTGSAAARRRAQAEMLELFEHAQPADPALAAMLVDRLLSITIEGAEPWPRVHPEHQSAGGLTRIASEGEPVRVDPEDLPEPLRARWDTRVQLVPRSAPGDTPRPTSGKTFRVSGVETVGAFARLGIDYEGFVDRGDARPASYAGGITVYLLETDDGWQVVSTMEWIT